MVSAPPIRGIFRDDLRARAAYAEGAGIYRILPNAVALPVDTEDLRTLVRWAAETRTPLVPRGAGSAMGGGNVGHGIIVDLTAFPRRLDLDSVHRVARASTNVTLAELNAAALEHGLRLPPDPSSGRWATLGGMFSTNAAGARSVRYGSVRPWVEAATVVLGNGELRTFRRGEPAGMATDFAGELVTRLRDAAADIAARFPRVRKNASGYALDAYLASGDLLDLLIGAEGTLGIVTEITWRLDPIPPVRGGMRLWLSSLDQLSAAVQALEAADASAIELLDRTFLDLTGTAAGSAEAVLLVEIERDDAETVAAALAKAAAAVTPLGIDVETARSPEDTAALWALRHAASPRLAGLPVTRRSLQVIEDACVPIAAVSSYVRTIRAAAARHGIEIVVFGHAGDGHVHANILPDVTRPGWENAVGALLTEASEAVSRLGGTLSGEHGDGRLRAPLLRHMYGATIVELFERVKRTFDPLGILNPGIILPADEGKAATSIAALKVGADAVALPDDIAAALRGIEQQGGYARRRIELA